MTYEDLLRWFMCNADLARVTQDEIYQTVKAWCAANNESFISVACLLSTDGMAIYSGLFLID